MSKAHEDLKAWQHAMALAEEVYSATAGFPDSERFGLVAQLRRAAVSVPSNIAEGRGRGHDAELVRFLGIAYASLMEVETQLELARRLGFLAQTDADDLRQKTEEVGRLINGLKRSLQSAVCGLQPGRSGAGSGPADRRLPTADSPAGSPADRRLPTAD